MRRWVWVGFAEGLDFLASVVALEVGVGALLGGCGSRFAEVLFECLAQGLPVGWVWVVAECWYWLKACVKGCYRIVGLVWRSRIVSLIQWYRPACMTYHLSLFLGFHSFEGFLLFWTLVCVMI